LKEYNHFCELCNKGFYRTLELKHHLKYHPGNLSRYSIFLIMFFYLSLFTAVFAIFIASFTGILTPGTIEFFLHQVVGWGTYSFSFAKLGYLKWAHLQSETWGELVGEWGFRVSFWIQLFWSLPLFVLMLFRLSDKGHESFTKSLGDYVSVGDTFYLESVIFTSLFAFMLKDCFLFYDIPDMLMAAHHFWVMLAMLMFYFVSSISGITALAFATIIAELGTSTYCSYQIWNTRILYVIMMSASNVAVFIIITFVTYNQNFEEDVKIQLGLYFSGIILLLARQAVLIHEICIKEEKKPSSKVKPISSENT